MNADDYQKLKDIFNSALDLPTEDRSAFIAEKCAGNEEMLRRVEKLLDSSDSTFLETPVADPLTETTSDNCSRSGQRIGHYEVIRRVGSGGMGDVYLAVDGKLGRQVAIKILPDEFTTDENRLDRFQLEARSASSLSHPNILTIFEIGEWEGTHYIATEYVEGETLRQRLSNERLSIGESMDLGIQLASAIAAAHEASICHRDIKPENIMIRRDGLLKVVDFGLAKLTASPFRSGSSPTLNDEPTVKIVNTEPGVIMGTVQYMSPEQTRGLATDERSDIWSLGCVLYEMLTGHAPFKGDTSADMVAEIVKTHPELPSRLATDIPERLDEIISKSLEKHPDERYQTAKDLLIDLKRLKRNLELEDVLERSNPSMRSEPITAVTSGPNIISTKKGPKDLTEVNSAQYLYWGMKAHRWTAIGLTLFVIGLVGGTAMLVRSYWRQTEIVTQPLIKNPTTERLTGDGKTQFASISSDGRFLTYVKVQDGQSSLWVKQIATNSHVQLVAPGVVKGFQFPLFSPDTNFVYFTGVSEETSWMSSIFRVPTLGGPLTEVLHHAGWPSFSPDGDEIVFHTEEIRNDGTVESILEIVAIDGSNRRRLTSTVGGKTIWKPAWSPDGNLVAYAVSDVARAGAASIVLIDPKTGETVRTIIGDWFNVRDIVWQPDMKSLLFEANNTGATRGAVQIWQATIETGSSKQVTQGIGNHVGVSLTHDGKKLVTVLEETSTAIWVSKDPGSERAVPITSGSGRHHGFDWIDENQMVYSSSVSGVPELWTINSDGTGERQLTHDQLVGKFRPAATKDRRFIFYNTDGGGRPTIWRMELDGTNAIPLSGDAHELLVDLSPDDRWLFYILVVGDQGELWKRPTAGGEPVRIEWQSGLVGIDRISPDGKLYAGIVPSATDKLKMQIRLGHVEGGTVIRTFDIQVPLSNLRVEWLSDGKSITYVDTTGNLWKQPIDGLPAKQMTTYRSDGVLFWGWSPNTQRLAMVRGETSGDAVSLSDF